MAHPKPNRLRNNRLGGIVLKRTERIITALLAAVIIAAMLPVSAMAAQKQVEDFDGDDFIIRGNPSPTLPLGTYRIEIVNGVTNVRSHYLKIHYPANSNKNPVTLDDVLDDNQESVQWSDAGLTISRESNSSSWSLNDTGFFNITDNSSSTTTVTSSNIKLIDFAGQKIFETATVDVNILIFEKNTNKKATMACVAKSECRNNLNTYIKNNSVKMNFANSDSWTILTRIEQSIKEKIEKAGTPLRDWGVQINYGIKTGFNDAFIITGEKKEELIKEDPKSAEIIRPILRGRDIKRYGYIFPDLWLINVHNGIKNMNVPPICIDEYPAIKQHLDMYYEKLSTRTDKGDTAYNLRNCAYMDDFSKRKIMYNDICQRLSFSLIPENIFCVNTVYFIKDNAHLEYLLAVLNSNLIDWYYRTLSVQLGEKAVRMFSIYVQNIPIPYISEELEREIALLSKSLSSVLSKENEKKLEEIIQRIYGLTGEEKEYINKL